MFLSASRRLTRRGIMGMEMSRAIGDGVVHSHVPLEPLVQIARLSNIHRNPTPILRLAGIDVIARQRPERSLQGINLVGILLAGLAGPVLRSRRRVLRLPVTTE